jgi:hypothetical protein
LRLIIWPLIKITEIKKKKGITILASFTLSLSTERHWTIGKIVYAPKAKLFKISRWTQLGQKVVSCGWPVVPDGKGFIIPSKECKAKFCRGSRPIKEEKSLPSLLLWLIA